MPYREKELNTLVRIRIALNGQRTELRDRNVRKKFLQENGIPLLQRLNTMNLSGLGYVTPNVDILSATDTSREASALSIHFQQSEIFYLFFLIGINDWGIATTAYVVNSNYRNWKNNALLTTLYDNPQSIQRWTRFVEQSFLEYTQKSQAQSQG